MGYLLMQHNEGECVLCRPREFLSVMLYAEVLNWCRRMLLS